jgi:hypothetical protein
MARRIIAKYVARPTNEIRDLSPLIVQGDQFEDRLDGDASHFPQQPPRSKSQWNLRRSRAGL